MSIFNKEKVNTLKQPMFFGEELNTQRYDEFKYPIFDKLTQTQLGYFWRPEEVSLQKDRNDYQQLDEGQKHIYIESKISDTIRFSTRSWSSFSPTAVLFYSRTRGLYISLGLYGVYT